MEEMEKAVHELDMLLEQLNCKMDKVINLLEKGRQNQSSDVVIPYSCEVQLSVRDLVEMYVAREQRLHRQGGSRKT